MASVSPPRGRSPHSTYGQNSDEDHSWEYIDYSSGGSKPSSVGFLPSPSTGSLNGYGIIGHMVPPAGTPQGSSGSPSASSLSPMFLSLDANTFVTAGPFQATDTSYPDQANMGSYAADSASMDASFTAGMVGGQFFAQDNLLWGDQGFGASDARAAGGPILTPSDMALIDAFPPALPYDGFTFFDGQSPATHQSPPIHQEQQSPSPLLLQQQQQLDLGTLQMYQHEAVSRQWATPEMIPPPAVPDPVAQPPQAQSPIIIESGYSSSSRLSRSSGSPCVSDPASPDVKQEPGHASPTTAIRKVKSGKVSKNRHEFASKKEESRDTNDHGSKFFIVTPNSINASAGNSNPYFECFEAMRATQKGRKGPLGDQTRANALKVRQLGACFCRKVKCDNVRPCRNCEKIKQAMPHVVCWQFEDFTRVLFPPELRENLREERITRFLGEHVDNTVTQTSFDIEFHSGPMFGSVLRLPARIFQPRTVNIVTQYHVAPGNVQGNLTSHNSAPLMLDLDTGAQRDALKKAAKDYILALTKEPEYVGQTTQGIKNTDISKRVLAIAQEYANTSNSQMVKRALATYSAHYIYTRHLYLKQETMHRLAKLNLVPPGTEFMTSRVASLQIKAVIDKLLAKDMETLFKNFSRSLKPKSEREWAPCTAAFLVLCLFLEAIETAADMHVVHSNEMSLREHEPVKFRREYAFELNRNVESLPFRQFAHQFHQIYQTHIKDGSAKAYNPLVDDSQLGFESAEHPAAALAMTTQLRELLRPQPRGKREELEMLAKGSALPGKDAAHMAFPKPLTYTGRLISRFLLSFTSEKYIQDGAE